MTNNYAKKDSSHVTKKDLEDNWEGVIVDYIYYEGDRYDSIFAHAKALNRKDDPEDYYYELMIPSLDFFYCYVDRKKIVKFL